MPYDEEMAVLDNPLLKQEEEVQYGGYNQPTPEQAMAQDFPPLAQQPVAQEVPQVPPINPRQQYIDAQLRLADLIRQRGEREANVPPGERQPSPEELSLKQQISQTGQELGPSPAAVAVQERFRAPVTQVDVANQQLVRAERQANQALRSALSGFRARNVAEASKALAYYKQQTAGNRWRTIYQDQINQGVPAPTASANAWREVAPMVFASVPQALSPVLRAAQPPPVKPPEAVLKTFKGENGVNVQAWVSEDRYGRQTVHPVPQSSLPRPDVNVTVQEVSPGVKIAKGGGKWVVLKNDKQVTPKEEAALLMSLGKRADMDGDVQAAREYFSRAQEASERALKGDEQTTLPAPPPVIPNPPVVPVQPPPVSTIPPGEERAAQPLPTTAAPQPTQPAEEVVRLTKDGRRAVYDARTKKFLRYAQ